MLASSTDDAWVSMLNASEALLNYIAKVIGEQGQHVQEAINKAFSKCKSTLQYLGEACGCCCCYCWIPRCVRPNQRHASLPWKMVLPCRGKCWLHWRNWWLRWQTWRVDRGEVILGSWISGSQSREVTQLLFLRSFSPILWSCGSYPSLSIECTECGASSGRLSSPY